MCVFPPPYPDHNNYNYTSAHVYHKLINIAVSYHMVSGTHNSYLFSLTYTYVQPLLSKLTDSNTEIIALDQEVTRLQELADELQREKSEKKPLKEDGSIHTNNEATNIKPINLIDLNSPRDGDKNLCTPREQSVDIEPPIISHDILSESILESSLNLQAELLQPLVVEDKEETTSGSSRHEPNSSFIQQSQELF